VFERERLEAWHLLLATFPRHPVALHAAFNSPYAHLWVYGKGECVGASITSTPTPAEGELHFFAIAPAHQKRGIGRSFYCALEAVAFSDARRIIAVSSVPLFFEKPGFFDRTPCNWKSSDRYMLKVK
jgi:N-acetylglutamate synthase-like GNAT family acetyltransferase